MKSIVLNYCFIGGIWWSRSGSNRRPPECHSGALPAELRPLRRRRVDREARPGAQEPIGPRRPLARLPRRVALDHVGHLLVLAELGGVLDQALVLLGVVLGLDDAASSSTSTSSSTSSTSVSGNSPSAAATAPAAATTAAGGRPGGCGGRGRGSPGRTRRRRSGRRSANVRSRRSGRHSSGRSAWCPIRAWPNVFSDGLVASERGNCHDRPKLSKANSARTGGSEAKSNRAGSWHVVAGGAARRSVRCGTLPGDKSISHRSLMLAALAVGESRIAGLLEGEDVLATAAALRRWGSSSSARTWQLAGLGRRRRRLGRAGRGPRPRQCRHRRPLAHGHPRRARRSRASSPATPPCAPGRCAG